MIRTITEGSIAEYTVQRSRFIACTAPVKTEEEAQAFLAAQKKKYYDARHHCSAWILGNDASKQKSSDDGEPSGTAGAPILDILKHGGFTDSIIVVTRYFGGIKLGTGGLTRAYGHAAQLGIEAAKTAKVMTMERVIVRIAYPLLGAVENELRQSGIRIEDSAYAEDVTLTLLLTEEQRSPFRQKLADLTAGQAVLTEDGMQEVLLPE
ncbi:YigZ family protein [Schwartzia sp. (in: firmicutes)]